MRMSITTLGFARGSVSAGAITIASLFDGGKPGIYVRPRPDTGTVWTDAGSTAAGDADVLGQIDALAGSVASYGQTSPAAKPILRNRGAEGWLAEFDGGDDDMITNATVDFSGVSTVTFVGYVKATVTDGSIQRLLMHGTSSTGDGRLFIQAPQSSTNHFRAIMTGGGDPDVVATGATYAPPQGRVVRAEFTTASRVRLWLDGAFIGEATGGAVSFLNDNLLIGSLARAIFHQGEIGSHAWIGGALTTGEASAADAEIAADHGVTLGAASAPSAFTAPDWSVASDASTVTISTLPADGGSAITDIEYRVNGGSAVSLGETTTGTYAITASAGDDIEIRAVNSVGAGAWSDTKTAIDADAATYIAAVETADGQALESGVVAAINDFVSGCKSDGIWTAINASCILAGARTLNGALVPLAGTAPTNFNFVSADYDRKTGLKGNGTTKYLDSNRNIQDDPLNDCHISAYASEVGGVVAGNSIGTANVLLVIANPLEGRLKNDDYLSSTIDASPPAFAGFSRASSASVTASSGGSSQVLAATSVSRTDDFTVFKWRTVYSSARLSFYSIGESLDLAALDTRVSALMTALDGAIA